MLQSLDVAGGEVGKIRGGVVEGVAGVEDWNCFGVDLFVDGEETRIEELDFCAWTAFCLASQCMLGATEDVAVDLKPDFCR